MAHQTSGGGAYRVTTATRTSRIGLTVLLGFVVFLAATPLWGGRAEMRLIVEICYFLALAQMWNLLAGYAGLVSVGQQAFVGLGGYALFVFTIYLGVPPLAAVALAGVAAAVFALPTAFVVFRLRGAYFAIGTWVVAEVYRLGFAQVSALGGGSGQSLPLAVIRDIAGSRAGRDTAIFYVGLGLAVAATGLVYLLLRSRHGLALTAMRDSEPASESLGVNTYKAKLVVYVVAAAVTGVVGALIYLQKLRISPDAAFNVIDWTAYVIFIVVIGGIGRIEGPIVGTIVFFVLREFLSELGSWYLIILGAVAILVMLRARQGLWGLVADRWGLHIFPVQRRLEPRVGPDSG
ncbi:MAG TPA: branched-chain amino acid ABC transporter permease [Alphaproteobacteria bacterium]|nr:branched-chain amino acid ABC transporter permease [Alphaproteobacteria bacterium]